jgi:hypothetical protein
VFVATMANRLYALDADETDPAPDAGVVWTVGPEVLGDPIGAPSTSALGDPADATF